MESRCSEEKKLLNALHLECKGPFLGVEMEALIPSLHLSPEPRCLLAAHALWLWARSKALVCPWLHFFKASQEEE